MILRASVAKLYPLQFKLHKNSNQISVIQHLPSSGLKPVRLVAADFKMSGNSKDEGVEVADLRNAMSITTLEVGKHAIAEHNRSLEEENSSTSMKRASSVSCSSSQINQLVSVVTIMLIPTSAPCKQLKSNKLSIFFSGSVPQQRQWRRPHTKNHSWCLW